MTAKTHPFLITSNADQNVYKTFDASFLFLFNPYRTEKKSCLQDFSGFSEPLRRARIFDELAVYDNEFIYSKINKKLFLKVKVTLNICIKNIEAKT